MKCNKYIKKQLKVSKTTIFDLMISDEELLSKRFESAVRLAMLEANTSRNLDFNSSLLSETVLPLPQRRERVFSRLALKGDEKRVSAI